MKYYDLLRTSVGAKTSAPTEAGVDKNEEIADIKDSLNKILAFMENQKSIDNDDHPEEPDETALNEKEVENVLNMLLGFQEKYFDKTPISLELEFRFIWNIPRKIYDAAMKSKNKGWPDCTNPLYWFYIFCTSEPGDMLGRFMINAVNAIPDEEYEQLYQLAVQYDEAYSS